MADTIDEIIEKIVAASDAVGRIWDDYGRPGGDEYRVVVDSAIDYMGGLEGSVAMELPNVGLKFDRDDSGRYNVYIKVGTIENDGE